MSKCSCTLSLKYLPTQGLGVEGVFVDCPSTAMQWRRSLPPPTPHVNTLQAQVCQTRIV